ncbi:MAG: TauD/TfdA family dioxygenase, partial [Pseudomonadota bacterium]
MKTTPLHSRFGVIVEGVDLRAVTAERHYPELRDLFERHSAILLRGQHFDDDDHMRLAALFGPIENREAMHAGRDIAFEVPKVSNET